MKVDELLKGKYFKVADLENRSQVLTIDRLTREKIGNPPEEKSILWFDENPQGLVLNKTKLKKLKELYGGETNDWAGKKVALMPSETQFGGEMVPTIRLSAPSPKKGSVSVEDPVLDDPYV